MALAALVWIMQSEARAQRFLDLTGLTPESLRQSLGEMETLCAVFDFLAAHEPDLLGAAEALGVAPAALVAAGTKLAR